jgi:hypothetical protein
MSGVIHPLPHYAFLPWCSVKIKHRDDFTFNFMFIYLDKNFSAFMEPEDCFNVHKRPPLDHILGQLNPVHPLTPPGLRMLCVVTRAVKIYSGSVSKLLKA